MAKKSNAQRLRNLDTNPCIEEADNSQRCLDAHNYNKDMCSEHFNNYKSCREYWHQIVIQRRRGGIKPEMPNAEERAQIIAALNGKPY